MLSVNGPAGDFDDPDAELLARLRSRLVESADEFWSRNKGDVGFHITRGKDAAFLILNFSKGRGYHVLHEGFSETRAALARVDGSNAPVRELITALFESDVDRLATWKFKTAS